MGADTYEKYEELKEQGEIFSGSGYEYTDDNGEQFMEFHVDDHEDFSDIGDTLPFGGGLSVRKNPALKPLLIFGQGECIFKQYTFRSKCWNGPKGQVPLMPKDKGQGLMISAFVSREYGFNWQLTDKQLGKANKYI